MARLSRFVAVAVLLGGATVSLSACTGDADPAVSPSPSVTASATPTPSVSPTPTALSEEELLALIPEVARRSDFIGASAFGKFFVQEYERMFAEHDSALFALVSSPECKFCASSLQSFAEDEAAGSTVVGGEITPADGLAMGGLQSDGTWLVQFAMHVSAAQYFNRDGSLRSSEDAADFNVGISLTRVDEHWSVAGLNFEPAS